MAALFRRKKHLDVSGAPQKKGRSQSLDPTSLAYLNLKQMGGGSPDKKGQTIERLTVPESGDGAPTSGSSSPNRVPSPNRRASDLFEGGLRQFQQLYKRRGSREPDADDGSKSLQVPKPRQRSGSVDVGRLTGSAGRRGSTEGSRSLPQQGRRGSVDPGLRIYSALRSNVNGVRRGSVDANVKQFQAVYQQRKALKSEQAAMYAAGSGGSTSPVPVSIPESPEITSRYHKPRPGSAAAAAAAAAAAELDAVHREMKSHSTVSSASFNANLYRRHDDPYRRRSLSGGDAISDSNRMAILFRDSRGLPAVDPFMDSIHSTDLKDDESQIYIKFFKFHKCYDLIPTSAKLVVFDTQLLVKKAFFALVYNGVRAAPLWDSSKQQYVGMLTITDFIRILQMYYRNSDERIEELEEHKLDTWRTVLESDSKPLIYIEPEASLFDAITTLLQNKIHRLPVIDPVSGDVLYIITHKRILRFLCLYLHNLPRPSLLNRTLGELRIGTYEKIETARPGTPVIEALTKFVERRVSALPIVDADNKLTHIYAKFDVINLAAEKTYNNLDVPLMTANSHRSENKVEACRLSDTLLQVLEKIVHAEVHRLVITDDDQHVIGIISLSDILDALVIRPHEYNTMAESNSGSEPAGDDEPHMIVEEEPGDEEDPVAAAAGIGRLNLSDPGHKDG